MATAHAFLGGCRDVDDLVRRILDELLRAGREQTWFERARSLFGKIEQVGLFGVDIRLAASDDEIRAVSRSFGSALQSLTEKLRSSSDDPKAGVVIILDDINGMTSSQEFADWLKSTVDKIAVLDPAPSVALMIVGLEERRQELIGLVPSLARVFDLIQLQPWSNQETEEFFADTFDQVHMRIEPDALEGLVSFSGGLPTLAHELGDAVFRIVQARQSENISADDVLAGLVDAAEIVGRKHLAPQVLEAIRGKAYLKLLKSLGQLGTPLSLDFTRAELISAVPAESPKNIDSFLRRLRDLQLISRGSERGSYRFVSHLARVFLWLESRRIDS